MHRFARPVDYRPVFDYDIEHIFTFYFYFIFFLILCLYDVFGKPDLATGNKSY